jgi:hypothetical protein
MSNENLVPTGIYRGRAVSGVWRQSSKRGTEFCDLVCEITQDGAYKGRRLSCSLWFKTEEGAERAMRSLSFCGVDMQDPIQLIGLSTKEVDLQVEIEDPAPRTDDPTKMYPAKNKVAWINEPGSSIMGREMSLPERSTFAARLLGLRAKMGLTGTANDAPQGAPPTGPAQTSPGGGGGKFDKF